MLNGLYTIYAFKLTYDCIARAQESNVPAKTSVSKCSSNAVFLVYTYVSSL